MAETILDALGSIPVDKVQALADSLDADSSHAVPPRYLRQEAMADPIASEGDAELPVIDFTKLADHHPSSREEAAKLHRACSEWGFFQLINHGVPEEVIEKMKTDAVEFFKLPLDEKAAVAQLPKGLEGYGQAFVLSNDQKLDWGDMLFVVARPIQRRKIRFWPTRPATFSDSLSCYSLELKRVASALMEVMAKNLEIAPEKFSNIFHDQPQGIRINYYPPCPKAGEVLGISPHTDAGGLTLLLQINDVQGLQIKHGETWFPVKPLPGALIANVGDIMEMLSNGEYTSIEHRATINSEKERLSIAAFHGPREDAVVGPFSELVVKKGKEKYKTMDYQDYVRAYFSEKLHGRRLLESFKL